MREPEVVRAFRDTWKDGIHSYLNYLRDRLIVSRDLLAEAGSIFVQIGDDNVHLVRSLMDEVYGDKNFVSQIAFLQPAALVAPRLGRKLLRLHITILYGMREIRRKFDIDRFIVRRHWKMTLVRVLGVFNYKMVRVIRFLHSRKGTRNMDLVSIGTTI